MEAVPAPHQQERAAAAAGDRVEGAEEAAAVLTPAEVQAILDGCEHCGTACCWPCSMTPACGSVRHWGCGTTISPPPSGRSRCCRRDNDNGARAKSITSRTVPVSAELIRLYADYLHAEYGDLDSDYVFVNLWGRPLGRPWTYAAVYDLVRRLRRRTGVDFDPHWIRHTAATRMLRDGIGLEVVAKLLGHSNVTVTATTYGHLTVEDARAVLEKAGWFDGRQVAW